MGGCIILAPLLCGPTALDTVRCIQQAPVSYLQMVITNALIIHADEGFFSISIFILEQLRRAQISTPCVCCRQDSVSAGFYLARVRRKPFRPCTSNIWLFRKRHPSLDMFIRQARRLELGSANTYCSKAL